MAHTVEDISVIYADDFTRVFAYQSRQFTLGDLSLRKVGGIQWDAAFPALLAGALALAAAWLLVLPLPLSAWWSLLAGVLPMLPVYVRMAKERGAGLTETQKLHLWLHFRYRQPREVLGMTANTEPGDFTWDAILWHPTGRRWAGTSV